MRRRSLVAGRTRPPPAVGRRDRRRRGAAATARRGTTRRPTPGARSRRGTPSMIAFDRRRARAPRARAARWASASSCARWATISSAARRASSMQLLALLVADPQRRLRQPHVAVRRAPDAGGAHRVVVDHRVGDLGDALEVVGGAGRDRAEDDLLGDAAAEQHGHVVEQLLARLQVAVLGGQVERVAERAAARDDRDPVHAVDATAAARRTARGRPRGRRRRASRARSARVVDCTPAITRSIAESKSRVGDRLAAAAGGEDRRLVADVREVGAGQAARLLGDEAEVDVLAQRLVARVHLRARRGGR